VRILVTGNGKSGSWKIRGEQLGKAIGASVIPYAKPQDIRRYDVCIFIKHHADYHQFANVAVWDMVDCWKQPQKRLITDVSDAIKSKMHGFSSIIAANEQMREDLGATVSIPHHYRSGMAISSIRNKIQTIGYEGDARFLGEWQSIINGLCARRGWQFVINPAELASCDVLLGLRGNEWRSQLSDRWKSGVKLANAIGAGVPFVGLPECGYTEMGVPFVRVESELELECALDNLDGKTRLSMAYEYAKARDRYSIDTIARGYLEWLHGKYS